MAKTSYWVVCKYCGRLFDYGKEGGGFDGNKYICISCLKTTRSQQKINGDLVHISQNQSWFKRNWKILFGVFFLIGGFGNIGENVQSALFGIIVGAVLTYAHFHPQIKAIRLEKAEKAAELEAREAELKAKRAEVQAVAEEPKRCKACGATTKGKICEYCGSLLD